MFTRTLALLLAVAAVACDEVPSDGAASGPPCGGEAVASVTLGFGAEDFVELASGAVAPQVFGPQGGSHVFVGARLRGFRAPVDLLFEARDAYSGARIGTGRAAAARISPRADAPAGTCDHRGTLLYLNGLFPGGAGLADVRVTARDATGATSTATRRVWIGRELPACVPQEGEDRLVPLTFVSVSQRRDEALPIVDGALLRPTSAGDVLVGAGVTGMAAGSVALTARLFEENGGQRVRVREVIAEAPRDEAATVPTMRRTDPECVAPVTLRLPVDRSIAGRALLLSLTADDGRGHARTVERVVTFEAPPPDAGVIPPQDVPDAAVEDVPTTDAPVGADVLPASGPSGLTLRSEVNFGLGWGGHAREIVVDGDTVLFADSNGLPTVAMDASGATRLLNAITTMRMTHCSTGALHARSRTFVCAAADSGYMDFIDVHDPAAPRYRPWSLSANAMPGQAPISEVSDVEVVGDTVWMAARQSGLVRLTLGADGMPTALTRTSVGGAPVGLVSDGARLAVIDRAQGLSLRSLPELTEIASVALDGPPFDVAMEGDRVAVALGSEGARVFRVVGGALTPLARVQPRCVTTAVALSGDQLAVACLTGVTLYDLRGPTPRVAGFHPADFGMLDVAFTPRGLLAVDWFELDLLATNVAGVANVPEVPLGLLLRPGADARVGVRNPGDAPLNLSWRAMVLGNGASGGREVGGSLSVPAAGDALLALPFARFGVPAGEAMEVDVAFSAGGPEARTRVVWRASTEDPARGHPATGDRFPTLRRTVASPGPATLPPTGAPTLLMFLTVDCFLQWPQLEEMAWYRRRGGALPGPTILYLTTVDEDPFDPSAFMRIHNAADLPVFEWADYSRSVPGLESEMNFVRAFEDRFFIRLPGADFPHDYLLDADGTVLETVRAYRGRWPLMR